MRLVFFRTGCLKRKALLFILASLLFIFFFYRGVHDIQHRVISIEFFAKTHSGSIVLKDQKKIELIMENLSRADVSSGKFSGQGRYRLQINRKSGSRTFWLDEPGVIYEPGSGKLYRFTDGGSLIRPFLEQVDSKNPYGEFLSWDTAKGIFKKYNKARVIDFETGMSFMVQRRAGSRHADVQPLTAEDSDIMKLIYGGRWSWKRRAVIVETGGRRIAGSMNGMPHGAGAIRGNKFNGHFCIHFRDSKLHSSGVDGAHQLMVWKAAGIVEDMAKKAKPREVVRMMMTALEQDDKKLVLQFLVHSDKKSEAEILGQLQQINWIAVSDIAEIKAGQSVRVKASYKLSNGAQFKNRSLIFNPVKVNENKAWKINSTELLRLVTTSRLKEESTGTGLANHLAVVENNS